MLRSIPLLPVQRQQLRVQEYLFCQGLLHELEGVLQQVDEKITTVPEGTESLRLWFERAQVVERKEGVLERLKELSEVLEVLEVLDA